MCDEGFIDEPQESPRMISELCHDVKYSAQSLSDCITDLLVRCDQGDDADSWEYSYTFPADANAEPVDCGGLLDSESEIHQAHQFALDVLRSRPSSQANSRSNSNQADSSRLPILPDIELDETFTSTVHMDIYPGSQPMPATSNNAEDENIFLRNFASELGELPVGEISASVQYIPGRSSVSISVRPESERARESLRRRFDAIQLVRRTLRQVETFCT